MTTPPRALTSPAPPRAPRRRLRRLRLGARRVSADLFAPRPGVVPVETGMLRRVMLLWATGRAVNLALLWGFFELARALRWGHGPDGIRVRTFLQFLTGWDADRYGAISEHGYPMVLPMNAEGDVLPNNWAFLPLFPLLRRLLTSASGMPGELAAVLVSLAASAGATWVLFLLLRAVAPPRAAWGAVVVFTFAPLSFVFALGYAESLFLLLTFLALLLAVRRRYLWIAPVGVAAAFTRPGALAIALALGILFLVRVVRRRADPFPPRQAAGLVVAGLAVAAAGLSWPLIADAVTGVPNAYIRTETGWWLESVGNAAYVPLTPWFRQAGTHLGVAGIVLVVALVAGFVALLASRAVRRMGVVVLAYAFSYGLYLFAVFLPQQSTFRLLMPLSPLLGDERLSATPRRRVALLGGSLALQVLAVWLLWTINHP